MSRSDKKKRLPFTKNAGLKLLSLAFSIMLYSWVHGAEDVRRALDVDVIVIPPGADSDHILVSELPPVVRLTVHGSRSAINAMTSENLPPVEIDLRDGTPSSYYFSEDRFDLPAGVSLVQMMPANVDLEWAERMERTLPVELVTRGELADGLVFGRAPRIEPEEVTVVGPETMVAGLAVVRTESVALDTLREGEIEQRINLAPLPDHCRVEGVGFESGAVQVEFTVARDLQTRTFNRLEVEPINGMARRVRPSTVQVTVRGMREVVEAIAGEQIVPVVDLEDAPPAGGITASITLRGLPADVEVVAIQPTEVVVVR